MKRLTPAILLITFLLAILAAPAGAGTVRGVVYHDWNMNSRSAYFQRIDLFDAPLAGVDIYLLDGATEQQMVTTDRGCFLFDGLEPGTYLVDVGIDPERKCTSTNQALRIPDAVREGAVHVVAIGDSLGVEGSDLPYPERLAVRFSEMVEATCTNISVSGSATWQWLPCGETGYFEDRLAPLLPDTDVLTIALGANDLIPYVPEGPPYDPVEIISHFFEHPEYLFNIIPNIVTIANGVREINPDCDIVYVIYMNVANCTAMAELIYPFQPLASFVMELGLGLFRRVIGRVEGIVLADMLGALGDTWLDPYLIDEVHPNDEGHQLYADEIFRALGGVVIEGETAVDDRMFGFYAPDLIPGDGPAADLVGITPDPRIQRTQIPLFELD